MKKALFLALLTFGTQPARAFDTIAGWTGYCTYEFQHIPELANASAIFRVPISTVCECVAPRMSALTTDQDNRYIAQTKLIPGHLKEAFSRLFQACLVIYSPD